MIYTCTMNPAIDLYTAVTDLKPDKVNRAHDEDYQPNGKGVNVSIMLKRLGVDSVALGFSGGFTGRYIENSLNELDINTDFVSVDGTTRINVFINSIEEYKIVNQGPFIPQQKQEELLTKIKAIPSRSILIVSGSLPKGVPDSIFVEIAEICEKRDINLILDTSVKTVMQTLACKPFLLKPNEEELANLFNQHHDLSEIELITYGKELLRKGAQHVLVSRGAEGALLLTDDNLLRVSSPQGEVVNTACSGDAMLATFIGKQLQHETVEDSLCYASAIGASTAFSKGLSNLEDIPTLMKEVTIESIEEELK